MSVQAISAVFDLPGNLTSASERLVLLSLANHANRYGERAWPGPSTLQAETGLSEKTVKRALGSLRGRGLIRATAYRGRDSEGKFEATTWAISIPGLQASPEGQSDPTPPGHPDPTSRGQTWGQTRGQPDPYNQRTDNPPAQPDLSDDSEIDLDVLSAVPDRNDGESWDAYLKRVSG